MYQSRWSMLSHAPSGAEVHHVDMDNEGSERPSDKATTETRKRVYWAIAIGLITIAEGGLLVHFLQAREAYHADLAGPCLDECLGTGFGMFFAGFLLVAWPIAGFFLIRVRIYLTQQEIRPMM